jgi:hypothetical protein
MILATVTVGLGAAAMWSSRDKHSADPASGYFIPGLIEHANEVAKVEVKNKDEAYTLAKNGDAWGMLERSGYAVPIDKVREITNQIAYFEILEEKTSTPSLYPKLSVEDVETPDAGSTRITLSAAEGKVLADVLIGKPSSSNDPMAPGSLYVRKAGDAQSYEVKGRLNVGGTSVSMLDTEIVKIERERVRRVVTTHPDGEVLELVKDERTDANLTVQGIPEGREVKYPAVTDTIGSALAYLNFEDVKKAGEVDFNKPDAVTTEYETWDGLRVQLKTVVQKEVDYLSLSVSFDPGLRQEPATVKPAEDPENPTPPPADEPLKPEEEVRKEAEELQAHLSQWVFKVQGYRASSFKKRMSDMLKDLPEEEAPVETLQPPIDPVLQPAQEPAEEPVEKPVENPTGGG